MYTEAANSINNNPGDVEAAQEQYNTVMSEEAAQYIEEDLFTLS